MAGANIEFIISAVDQFSRQFDNLDRQINSAYKASGTLGKGLMAIGAGASAGMGFAVKTAANFEKQLSTVKAISGATGKDFENLTETAKKLGAETSFSATQAGEGMQYLALAGWKANDIISAMPGMLDMAAAASMDLGRAADITSDTMQAFGMKATEATHAADVFAYAQANANTDVEMLGEAMKYAAPMAHTYGWSLEQTAAGMMMLANSGIKGSLAGQAFASSLGRLAKPTKRMQKVLDATNLEFFNAKGQMKALPDIIAELERATAKMTDKQKAATLSTLFGAEAFKHWAVLLDGGSDSLRKMTTNLEKADGTAHDMAQTMLDNLNGQLIILKSALEGAAIAIGDALIPAIKFVVKVLQRLVDAFNSLPNGLKSFIAITMAVGAVLMFFGGLILWTISLLPGFMMGLNALIGVMTTYGTTIAVTIGWVFVIIAALIALGVVIFQIWKHSDTLQAVWTRSMAAMKRAGQATLNWLNGAFLALGAAMVPIIHWFKEFGQKAVDAFIKLGAAVKPILDVVIGALKNFGSDAKSAISNAMNFDFSGLAQMAAKFVPSILGYMLGGIPRLIIVGMNALKMIAEGMGVTVPELMTKIVEVVTGMIDSFLAQVPGFLEMGREMIMQLINGILAAIPGLVDAAVGIADTFVNLVTTMLPVLMDAGTNILLSLLEGIVLALPKLLTAAVEIIMALLTGIIQALPLLINAGINAQMALIGGIIQALPFIIDSAQNIMSALVQGLVTALPLIIGAAIALIVTLADALITMLPSILDAGIQILMALIDGILQLLPMLIESAVLLIFSILDALIKALPSILDAGIKIIMALISGLVKMLPVLVAAIIKLIIALVGGIIKMLPQLIKAGVELIGALIKGQQQMVGALVTAVISIGKNIWEQFKSIDLLDIGKQIIMGLVKGITGMAGAVKDAVVGVAKAIPGKIKDFLGIHSPSRVLMELGGFTGEGFAIGIADMVGQVQSASKDMAAAAVPQVEAGSFQPVQRRSNTVADVTNQQQKTDPVPAQSAEYSFEIPVVIDGREVARATAKFTKDELDRMENNAKRAKGVK
jgi:TP901 family phage tail tape measure protein